MLRDHPESLEAVLADLDFKHDPMMPATREERDDADEAWERESSYHGDEW